LTASQHNVIRTPESYEKKTNLQITVEKQATESLHKNLHPFRFWIVEKYHAVMEILIKIAVRNKLLYNRSSWCTHRRTRQNQAAFRQHQKYHAVMEILIKIAVRNKLLYNRSSWCTHRRTRQNQAAFRQHQKSRMFLEYFFK
jgi:hypothetical protein